LAPKERLSHFPSKDDILDFIKGYEGRVNKREISRSFGIKGQEKVLLKQMLREMTEDGLISRDQSRALRPANRLPNVQVIEFSGTDKNGDPLARPVNWEGKDAPPIIYISEKKGRRGPPMGKGDRALAKLTQISDEPPQYRADIIKALRAAPSQILGVFNGSDQGGRILPTDKKNRDEYWVDRTDVCGALSGELVLAEPASNSKRSGGPKRARITERLGDVTSAKSISLIAIHAHDIPHVFPQHVLQAAEKATPVALGKRADLRDICLITIDPVDARDHDDAIWAEADSSADNKGGWHAIVAIADVAHYVRPDSSLDKEALKRGNSCYFPDRVVPMLPETLSAGLCSLRPGEDRACLAVHMWFDKDGHKLKHKFVRALMNSHANVSYQQVQQALDGDPDELTAPLREKVLSPLYSAFKALMLARGKREPLELDLPERKIELDDEGYVKDVILRDRLDAHRIVEEFMISANVCAAEELEKHRVTAMYRVHETPPAEKLESLREFLATLELSLAKGNVMMPRLFNGILQRVKDTPHEHMVNEVVLRSQTQAYYSPENQGHFGLALTRYAHFTSPIRRYSDLLVHRGLIRALKLGDDGLTDRELGELDTIAEQISNTERRAMAAERDSTDRYMASFLADQLGADFVGRISGVTRFGLFVSLEPSGGDGLIPISEIGDDYYVLDSERHRLVGERRGQEFKLGDKIDVRLKEANRLTGGLKLELVGEGNREGPNKRSKRAGTDRLKQIRRRHGRSRSPRSKN